MTQQEATLSTWSEYDPTAEELKDDGRYAELASWVDAQSGPGGVFTDDRLLLLSLSLPRMSKACVGSSVHHGSGRHCRQGLFDGHAERTDAVVR